MLFSNPPRERSDSNFSQNKLLLHIFKWQTKFGLKIYEILFINKIDASNVVVHAFHSCTEEAEEGNLGEFKASMA